MKTWSECTPKQQVERWENVERVLKALTPHERRKHWNMEHWGKKTPCGTVGCAAGQCGLDPWFRRRGFQLNFYLNDAGELTDNGPRNWIANPYEDGKFEVRDFFGDSGSDEIFYNGLQRSVSVVIKEVKSYLKALKARSKGSNEDPEFAL